MAATVAAMTDSLAVEVTRVRWRAPDGDFAVLDGVDDDGEEVALVGVHADAVARVDAELFRIGLVQEDLELSKVDVEDLGLEIETFHSSQLSLRDMVT